MAKAGEHELNIPNLSRYDLNRYKENLENSQTPQLFNLKRFLFIFLNIVFLSIIYYLYQLWSYSTEHERSATFFEHSIVSSLDRYEYLPALLAKDNLVIELLETPINNHEVLSNKLEFTAVRSEASDIFLLNIQGIVVATSNYTKEHSFFNENYSFRPYFKKAIEERKRQFYFAKGVTTGIPGFFISDPVIKNDQVIGVMVVKLFLSEWESSWNNSNDNILVADTNNIIVLSSKDQWRYQTIGEISDEKLLHIYTSQQFPNETHLPIYSDNFSYNFGSKRMDYWKINDVNYVVNRINIDDTNWIFYHLVKHNRFLYRLLLFFGLLSLLGITLYFFLHERLHKLDLKKRARENERKRLHERQTLIDNIHIGVIVFKMNGRLLSMNEHAKELLITQENKQLLYKNYDNIHINELLDLELTLDNIEGYIQKNTVVANQYNETTTKASHSNGLNKRKIPLIFSIADFIYADKESYLMTIIDITRRKKVEDELIVLNESLEEKVNIRTQELKNIQNVLIQKNKTVALGNMAGTIVHELSQPLSAINSSVGALLNKMDKQNWGGASESAHRLLPLSNKMRDVINLLKFFSYPDNNNEVIELKKMVNQSVDILNDIFKEKAITLTNQHPDTSIFIQCNELKLDLVLSNLLKNAIDAVEHSEEPTISITSEINDYEDNLMVLLHIQDNGTGVDEHIMGQLFNPYFTTKEVGKGMGLGLSITYEIIKQYGGDIAAENTDSGAKFTIKLPVYTHFQ